MLRVLCALVALAMLPGPSAFAQGAPVRPVLTGGVFDYVVRDGDTLGLISARFGAGMASLVDRNGIRRQDKLLPGQVLNIDNRHIAAVDPGLRITINLAQRMLFLVDGDVVWGLPIAVGLSGWPTPVGAFTVIDKEENPTWDVPPSIQEEMRRKGEPVITSMPPGPDNPLGAHWLRLSLTNIGIHGTVAPSSIYNYASHGCMRMHADDVAFLFAKVDVGTAGATVYRPVTIALIDGRVWVEAHPDGYRRAPDPLTHVRGVAEAEGFSALVDWPAVEQALKARRGIAVYATRVD